MGNALTHCLLEIHRALLQRGVKSLRAADSLSNVGRATCVAAFAHAERHNNSLRVVLIEDFVDFVLKLVLSACLTLATASTFYLSVVEVWLIVERDISGLLGVLLGVFLGAAREHW